MRKRLHTPPTSNIILCFPACAALFLAAGCHLTGTWDVSEIIPPPAPDQLMLSAITFSSDGRYTATESAQTRRATSTGLYDWNGLRLRLKQQDADERAYPARLDWDFRTLHLEDPSTTPIRSLTLRRVD